jgi:hypothetical protein
MSMIKLLIKLLVKALIFILFSGFTYSKKMILILKC